MGSTLQVTIKCCNSDDLDVNNDDYAKLPIANQMPTITEDTINKLVTISDDSFTTTIPCNFPH